MPLMTCSLRTKSRSCPPFASEFWNLGFAFAFRVFAFGFRVLSLVSWLGLGSRVVEQEMCVCVCERERERERARVFLRESMRQGNARYDCATHTHVITVPRTRDLLYYCRHKFHCAIAHATHTSPTVLMYYMYTLHVSTVQRTRHLLYWPPAQLTRHLLCSPPALAPPPHAQSEPGAVLRGSV